MIPPKGFFVMGHHTSVAWFLLRSDAEDLCTKLNYRGGTHHYVLEEK